MKKLGNGAEQSSEVLGNPGKRRSFSRAGDNLILFRDYKRHKIGRKYTV